MSPTTGARGGRPNKGKREPLTCRVPDELARRVIEAARLENITLSDYMARTLAWTHGYSVGLLPRAAPVDKSAAASQLDDRRWPDPDAAAVSKELAEVITVSGLRDADFAAAVGITPGAFEAFRSGRFSAPADLLRRATRLAIGLRRAEERGWLVAFRCGERVRQALAVGDTRAALSACLVQQRDLREALAREPSTASAWHLRAPSSGSRGWDTLLEAMVEHEFLRAGQQSPTWAENDSLPVRKQWVLVQSDLSHEQVRASTPPWLQQRGVFVSQTQLLDS